MKPLLLILLLLAVPAVAQQSTRSSKTSPSQRVTVKKPSSELIKLRDEYIEATKEYKASLGKLLPFYQADVAKAEDRLVVSRKMLADGLVENSEVEEKERALAAAQTKLANTRREMSNCDEQIKTLPTDDQLAEEVIREERQRRRARKPRCSNWNLTAYQRRTANSYSFGYKLVCLK
jgi:predicted  nucleic acid-binding Zn-ribbon protein